MFTAALFVMAKSWKKPKFHSVSEQLNTLVYPYSGILLGNKKEQTIDICNNLDKLSRAYC